MKQSNIRYNSKERDAEPLCSTFLIKLILLLLFLLQLLHFFPNFSIKRENGLATSRFHVFNPLKVGKVGCEKKIRFRTDKNELMSNSSELLLVKCDKEQIFGLSDNSSKWLNFAPRIGTYTRRQQF